MAARDQNLQLMRIYVALVTFLCAVFLVGWIWSAVSGSTKAKQMAESNQRAKAAEDQFRTLNLQLEATQGMFGVKQLTAAEISGLQDSIQSNPDIQKMADKWAIDMGLFGPNVPPQDRNYTNLVAYLMQELRARNQQVDSAAQRQDQLIEENKAVLTRETKAAEQERNRAADLEKQLASERADFTAKLEASQKSIDQTAQQLLASNTAHATEKNKLLAQVSALTKEAEELRNRNVQLAEKQNELENEDFQTPQGEVVGVGLDGRSVYIDLGTRDGLRTGVRFSVVDPNQGKIADARIKARLEVVDVTSTNARARVLEDKNSDPIVRGDLIYSPAWAPGRKVGFALLGKMDINDDGSDDRELIKSLILQSGGEISEELLPSGESFGRMTTDTRWLVVGDAFNPNAVTDSRGSSYQTKYADMEKRARGLAVSQMNIDKLMNWLRSSSDDRSIPFGAAAQAADLFERERIKSSGNSVSDIYQLSPQGPLSGN